KTYVPGAKTYVVGAKTYVFVFGPYVLASGPYVLRLLAMGQEPSPDVRALPTCVQGLRMSVGPSATRVGGSFPRGLAFALTGTAFGLCSSRVAIVVSLWGGARTFLFDGLPRLRSLAAWACGLLLPQTGTLPLCAASLVKLGKEEHD